MAVVGGGTRGGISFAYRWALIPDNNPMLFFMLQSSLKSHQIEKRFNPILLSQLGDGKGLFPCLWIDEAHRLERAISKGFPPPLGHLFNGKTSFKEISPLKRLYQHFLRLI